MSVATGDPGTVAGKQAEAQRIIAQIDSIDRQVSNAVERWNLANVKLAQIGRDLQRSRHELGVSKVNLKLAQAALARQAVSVYTSRDSNSTIEVLLGATSLDDLLGRLDTASRVSDQRSAVVGDVQSFQTNVKRVAARLEHAQSAQQQVVAQRAAERRSIENQLAQRKQLLSSVKSEIEHLRAVEASRQLQLAQAARSRPSVQPWSPAAGSPGIGAAVAGSVAAAPPSRYGGVVGIAMRYLGTQYVWGGASPSGFDCSGFVMYVYGQMGVSLPHSSYAQYGAGVAVSQSDLQAGDLVFFDGLGHVGIYIGGGQFIHSPHTGDVVKISSLTGWYASTYVGARRIL
ncbi:MAG: peptidoglycan DL-endopeptidase CwlO [Gaiellaceae bacterium]|nr:peptidoglycan DL-endopeptidase CwlO [Gaiellaceae bacterium]